MEYSGNSFIRRNRALFFYTIIFLIVAALFAFTGGGRYTYNSDQKVRDLIQADIWLVLSVIMVVFIYYSALDSSGKLWGWILTLSIYFVILYALLYKGTAFGFNGQWGDNGNRLALVTKFRDLVSPFQDWYFKGLPSFYPPLWFFVWGKLSWIFGFPGYYSIKLGYFAIYALYPIGLYYIWQRLASRKAALVIAILTVYFRELYLDYVYYEYITAAFFIPWWLYYVEDIKAVVNKNFKWYLAGGILGAIIFLTYYYWFFAGILAIGIRGLLSFIGGKKTEATVPPLRKRLAMLGLVGLFSSIYWAPLLVSILKYGADSMQNKWFRPEYLDFNVPFFAFSLISLIFLAGLIYLAFRYRSKLNRAVILILLGMILLILIDRLFNLNHSSIQTRKIRELLAVFLAVPSAFGLVLLYRFLSRHVYLRRAALTVCVVALYYIGNTHTAMTSDKMWQIAINGRAPTDDIEVFKAVDYKGKVFLTQRYLEAVYIPYYLFVCPNGATAHPASRYNQRIAMLKFAGKLSDPAQVAYLLKHNCFDAVDYFYLPTDDKKKIAYYDMYPLYFPAQNIKLTLEFPYATTIESKYFIGKHERGLYSVVEPEGSVTQIFASSMETSALSDLMSEYNRLNLAVAFLSKERGDSLRPLLAPIEARLRDSANLEPIFEFDRDIEMTDLNVASAEDTVSRLRIIFHPRARIQGDFGLFIHAYPDDTTLLKPEDRGKGFINLDIVPPLSTGKWVEGEYQLVERPIGLPDGRYRFHIGFLSETGDRLAKTYWSNPVEIDGRGTKK